MRFIELHLKAFGHFSGDVVHLRPPSASAMGLHMIVGANEAGKSTTLEAIARLMIGFPRGEEKYGFEHAKSKLRVGALIRRGENQELMVWRTKTRNELTVADGKQAVPQTFFEDILDSLAPETYWKLFGLNQEKLRSGGRELVRGRGDFSRILFGESLGELESFNDIRQKLVDEASDLFKPEGRNTKSPLNQIKPEIARLHDESEKATTTRERWRKLTDDLTNLNDRIESAESLKDRKANQLQRLQRLEKSRDPLDRIDRLNRTMDAFRDLPQIEEVTQLRSKFDRLVQEREGVIETLENARDEQSRHQDTIDSIVLDEELLGKGEAIVELAREATAAEQRRDRVARKKPELAAALTRIQELTRTLGFDPKAPHELPVCDKPGRDRLARSKQEWVDLRDRIAHSESKIVELSDYLQNTMQELAETPSGGETDAARLEAAAARIEEMLPRHSSVETLRNRIGKWERQRREALESLPGWSGTWESFSAAKLPDFELVRADADELESALKRKDADLEKLERTRAELAEKRAKLEIGRQQNQIPSPEELDAARSQRDRNWRGIRTRWLGDAMPDGEIACGDLDDSSLADRFETDLRRADSLADSLRLHLKSIEMYWECRDIESTLPGLVEKLAASETSLQTARNRWSSHFAFLPEPPQRPEQMQSWPSKVKKIQELTEEIESAGSEVERILADWHECRDSVVLPLLPGFTVTELAFGICRDKIRERRDSLIDSAARRTQLEKHLRSLRQEIEGKSKAVLANKVEFESRSAEWRRELEAAGFPSNLPPDSFESYVSELVTLRRDFDRYENDLEECRKDSDRFADFESRVTALAQSIRFADPETDCVRLAESMNRALSENRAKHDRRREAGEFRDLELKRGQDARDRLVKIEEGIARICGIVEADSRDDASERLDKIVQKANLNAEIDKQVAVLRAHAGLEPLEKWYEEVRDFEPDRAAELRNRIEEEIESVKADLKKSWDERYGIETELNRINSGRESVEVLRIEAERKVFFETTAAQMSRYLKCLLTSRVLKDASEEYRRRMGEQVIEMASDHFRTLSLGSFERLMTVSDDDSGRRLLAVRADKDRTAL